MTRAAPSTRRAASKADAAADHLADWLRQQHGAAPDDGSGTPSVAEPIEADGPPPDPRTMRGSITHAPREADRDSERAPSPRDGVADAGSALHSPHTDWLHHRMAVSGPTAAVAEFQTAARGPGVIPWRLDLGRVEEDLFHLLGAEGPST